MIGGLRRVSVSVILLLAILAPVASPASANSKYAALVVHADSGDVLFDRYADQARYPASLTKMMTLYLLFGELEAGRLTLESDLTVSAQAAGQPPSKLGFKAGDTINVETAINALIVRSANDVAVVVAEAISGSEWRFAQKMTEKAREIGMSRTTFRNASGLPNSKQRTTARDLATLGRRLIQDYPQYYDYFSTQKFTWNGRTYSTHNTVARTYPGAEGLKTGYTRVSGFNLATSASRDGNRLIGIVLGGRSVRTRDAHMKEILNGAFAQIKAKPALIASLHRETPAPRLKPTLVAELAMASFTAEAAPSLARAEIEADTVGDAVALASLSVGSGDVAGADAGDAIGVLIASADTVQDDLNEYEQVRLAALAPAEGGWSEGDADAAYGGSQGWNVQIGAYATKERAQAELEAAAQAGGLNERPRAVQPIADLEGEPLFRARFTSLSAADAADICGTLRSRGRSCIVISEPGMR